MPVCCLSVSWSSLPSFLLWERTLFSHRLQVRICFLLNQINPKSLLQNESARYPPNALQHQSPFKVNQIVLWLWFINGFSLSLSSFSRLYPSLFLMPSSNLLSSPPHSLSTSQMWPRLQWSSLWARLPDLPGFSVGGLLQPTPLLLPQLLLTSWGWGQLWLRGAGQRQGLGPQQRQQEALGYCSTRQFPGQVLNNLIQNE